MTMVFLAGALGSTLATISYDHGGWTATATVGAVLTTAVFLLFLTERRAA
jgi:predicted MFS family arabinose efflux permease